MKAAIYASYGPPDVVRIADVENPIPKDNEVLIKVRAASVNPLDWRIMKGEPRLLRLFFDPPAYLPAGRISSVAKPDSLSAQP